MLVNQQFNRLSKMEHFPILLEKAKIPWKSIFRSSAIWAIVVNNFTFHYALFVMMNWLPTYFEQGLKLSIQEMGTQHVALSQVLNMFIFSNIGGFVADYLITKRLMSVTGTRKFLNTLTS